MSGTVSSSLRAAPIPDADSAPFWEGTRRHEFVLQKCENCEEVRFPPMPRCPNCGDPTWRHENVEPRGSVYSWITVERPIGSIAPEEVPCTFIVAELNAGCRMVGRLSEEAPVAIGDRVTAVFVDLSEWSEVRFRLEFASEQVEEIVRL
jgi:uncharacterized OB-fold protein